MTNTETQSYDILIAGGGMVGLPLAIALSDAGLRVALVDRAPLADQVLPAFDGRVSAVAYSSRRMLEALGVWEAMQPHAEPILDIRVVDGHSHSFLHYTHDEVGVERFGYIVENRVIRQALNARAATCENLHIIAPTRILKFDVVDARVTLQLENGARLEASLLIGADGKNSQIRQLAGISALEKSYRQTAIIATIAHANPHHGMAMERFFANGPFAVLPMQQNRSSLVWVEPEAMAAHYLALDDATFISEIQKRAGEYLGEITLAVGRFAHPLGLLHAHRYINPRLALIGDAAHAIHPVAGQGVNLGWRDVAVLAELIVEAKRLGQDIGGEAVLNRYQRWRRFDNVSMLAVTDGLNRLFSNRSALLKLARGVGFHAVEAMPPVKKFFMRHAMGLVGDLPRLLQGQAL